MQNNIGLLKSLYSGFYIEDPLGNNAFSYDQRLNRRIFVPPFVEGDLSDLSVGTEACFGEVDECGKELAPRGLSRHIYWRRNLQHIFIFDNHNHAFCYWMTAWQAGWIDGRTPLVHVDQHSDMREPAQYLSGSASTLGMREVFEYTQQVLNVGNFIHPALRAGMFPHVDIVDSSFAFEKDYMQPIVLDIDIDIFAPEMAYIDSTYKLSRIRSYLKQAQVVTIATSPYFINQADAIGYIKALFEYPSTE